MTTPKSSPAGPANTESLSEMANLDNALKGLVKPGTGKARKVIPLKGGMKVKGK